MSKVSFNHMFLEIAQKAFEVLGYLPKDLWQVMSDLCELADMVAP